MLYAEKLIDFLKEEDKINLNLVSTEKNDIYILRASPRRITQNYINKFENIRYLNCSANKNITYINHMTQLETLICMGRHCGITRESIQNLRNIVYLEGRNLY